MATDATQIGHRRPIESRDRRRTIAGVILAVYMVFLSISIIGGPVVLLAATAISLPGAIKLTVLAVAIGYLPVVLIAVVGLPGSRIAQE